MLTSKKRSAAEINQYMSDLKAWIQEVEDTPGEEMASFFAARLEGYEDVHLGNWSAEYQAIADYFDEGLLDLLDIGCGTGLELHAMFRRFPHLRVTGIDLSPAMLGKLRENFPQQNIRLLQADYFQHPLGRAQFDAALSFETLHHFPYEKKLGLYQKLFDALRPDGYYVECDYVACCPEEESLCQARLARQLEKHPLPPGQFLHIDTPLTLPHQLELLQKAGFQDVRPLYENGSTAILRGEKPRP